MQSETAKAEYPKNVHFTVIRRTWRKRYKYGPGRWFGRFHEAIVWVPIMPESAVELSGQRHAEPEEG